MRRYARQEQRVMLLLLWCKRRGYGPHRWECTSAQAHGCQEEQPPATWSKTRRLWLTDASRQEQPTPEQQEENDSQFVSLLLAFYGLATYGCSSIGTYDSDSWLAENEHRPMWLLASHRHMGPIASSHTTPAAGYRLLWWLLWWQVRRAWEQEQPQPSSSRQEQPTRETASDMPAVYMQECLQAHGSRLLAVALRSAEYLLRGSTLNKREGKHGLHLKDGRLVGEGRLLDYSAQAASDPASDVAAATLERAWVVAADTDSATAASRLAHWEKYFLPLLAGVDSDSPDWESLFYYCMESFVRSILHGKVREYFQSTRRQQRDMSLHMQDEEGNLVDRRESSLAASKDSLEWLAAAEVSPDWWGSLSWWVQSLPSGYEELCHLWAAGYSDSVIMQRVGIGWDRLQDLKAELRAAYRAHMGDESLIRRVEAASSQDASRQERDSVNWQRLARNESTLGREDCSRQQEEERRAYLLAFVGSEQDMAREKRKQQRREAAMRQTANRTPEERAARAAAARDRRAAKKQAAAA